MDALKEAVADKWKNEGASGRFRKGNKQEPETEEREYKKEMHREACWKS